MSSSNDHAGRQVAGPLGGEPAPVRDIAALQRRFIDAVAELRRSHDELQSAAWLHDYDAAEVGEPARPPATRGVVAAQGQAERG